MKYYTLNGFVTCEGKKLNFTRKIDEGIMIQVDDEPMELARAIDEGRNYEMYMHEWAPWCLPRHDDFADIQGWNHPKSEPKSDLAKMLYHIMIPGEKTFKLDDMSIIGTFEYREDLGTRVFRLTNVDDNNMYCDFIIPPGDHKHFTVDSTGEIIPKDVTKEQFTAILRKVMAGK